MTIWTFLRHGQSRANAEGWFAGQRDSPLTARGEEQAIGARHQLAALAFTRVFASDLQRAWRTAELLLEGRALPIRRTPRLRERTCGSWEGRSMRELEVTGEAGRMQAWDGRPPAGESLRDVALRVLAWLSEHDSGEPTLVVAHGALMRSVLGVLDGRPADEIGLWCPGNCHAETREVAPGHWHHLLEQVRSGAAPR